MDGTNRMVIPDEMDREPAALNRRTKLVLSYGFALLVCPAALLLTKWMRPPLDTHFFELFQAAVLLSAWNGGMGPGILTSVISFFMIDYYLIPPLNVFAFNIKLQLGFIIFEAVAVLTGYLSGKLKWAKTELEAHIAELKDAKFRLERVQDSLEIRIEERTRELSQANRELKSEIAQRIEAEKAILDITNREQHRLGQDLHDGLCQVLTGVKFMTQGLREALAEKDAPESKRMGVIESQLGNALSFVDTVSRGLYPVELEVHGLMAALQELAERTSKVYPVSCRFKCGAPVSVEDGAVANHLYRIAQELVINAIKGGKAKAIHIRLFHRDGGSTVLSVADNGSGFGHSPMRRGMGIKMMEYRARVINGSLAFKSRPRKGTVAKCSFPARFDHGI